MLLAPAMQFGQVGGVHVEIAVVAGEAGAALSQELFRELEVTVLTAKTYRGRVLSLEMYPDFSGRGGAVKVHRLHRVNREDVILPEATLALLDATLDDSSRRETRSRPCGFPRRRGCCSTAARNGQDHTIHYLASQLPEHTTLLVTAEQVGFVGDLQLARFLQPAMMVIEDVDLIARDRSRCTIPPKRCCSTSS